MEKTATVVGGNVSPSREWAASEDLPPEYWQALLDDPRAIARPPVRSGVDADAIHQHMLRAGCRRCGRTAETSSPRA
jgi:hypothetical protein